MKGFWCLASKYSVLWSSARCTPNKTKWKEKNSRNIDTNFSCRIYVRCLSCSLLRYCFLVCIFFWCFVVIMIFSFFSPNRSESEWLVSWPVLQTKQLFRIIRHKINKIFFLFHSPRKHHQMTKSWKITKCICEVDGGFGSRPIERGVRNVESCKIYF